MLKIKQFFKITLLKTNVIFFVFSLLFGFLFGNIFGLNSKVILINFSEFIFFVFPLLLEGINFLNNQTKKNKKYKFLSLIIISFRRGFLLGIFIEAFKLGS